MARGPRAPVTLTARGRAVALRSPAPAAGGEGERGGEGGRGRGSTTRRRAHAGARRKGVGRATCACAGCAPLSSAESRAGGAGAHVRPPRLGGAHWSAGRRRSPAEERLAPAAPPEAPVMRRRGQPAAASVRWREARSLAGLGVAMAMGECGCAPLSYVCECVATYLRVRRGQGELGAGWLLTVPHH